jgi:hypothetical protein
MLTRNLVDSTLHEILHKRQRRFTLMIYRLMILLLTFILSYPVISHTSVEGQPVQNPLITQMIQKINESSIYSTVYSLQSFRTRYYGSSGNTEASTWLYNELYNISGLTVEYQNGEYRNVIATLPGQDSASSGIYMVGAHYDSINTADTNYAPGATDNAGGVAIVLELARIMSQYTFKHTLKFALWNGEEAGAHEKGSTIYTDYAKTNNLNISLYINFDSSCYDPDNHFILDIMSNDQSQWVSDLMTQYNSLYHIGFILTYNVHLSCWSDHQSFWHQDYTAVMTHEETHGPAHTNNDTIDKVSTLYAKKNGQLGMSVLAKLSEPLAPRGFQQDTISPIADAGPDQNVSAGAEITFNGLESSDNLGIAEYRWMFVDTIPLTLNGSTPTYSFLSPGSYTVVLNVTDFAGNYAVDAVEIRVNLEKIKPIAYAGVDQIADVNSILTIDGSGTSDNTGIVSYEWNFGDGTNGTGKIVTHAFSAPGTYTIILTVKDASGNIDIDTSQADIRSSQFQLNTNLMIVLIIVVSGIIIGTLLFIKRIL